jgi:hypothetical protein
VVGEHCAAEAEVGARGWLRTVAGGDWEALRWRRSGDEGAQPSRGTGKLRGEAVHKLGDGSRDRQRDDARCQMAASSRVRAPWRSRGCGGADGCFARRRKEGRLCLSAERIKAG